VIAFGTTVRRVVLALAVGSCLVGTMAFAQGVGSWRLLQPEDDLLSYLGLGAIYAEAIVVPAGMSADDTALLVACDPQSPVGFEISAFVDAEGDMSLDGVVVDVLIRPDQGSILERRWFLTGGAGYTDAVAFYDDTAELLSLLSDAATFALRVLASPDGYAAERTFQFDVRGFAGALAELRCAQPTADVPASPSGAPATDVWDVIAGEYASAGTLANGLEEVLVVFCRDDGNGIGVDVGAYGAPSLGPSAGVVFRSGSVDFLTTTARLNDYGSYELVDDVAENRLVRNMRLMTDVTVTLRPASGPGERSFTLSTSGFSTALTGLGCYVAPR
jgi:hypothetical protein